MDPQLKEQLKNVVAGAGAGCITAIVTCPLDVLKTRLQSQSHPLQQPPNSAEPQSLQARHPYNGIANSLRRMWREEGLRGLYRGLGPTLIGYLPTWTVYFGTYDRFKHAISRASGKSMDSSLVHLGGSICAGTLSTLLTNPLWVIKTRMMTQTAETAFYYDSTLHAVQSIWRTEGMSGFYKGLGPSLVGITHVAVQFPLYERFKRTTLFDRYLFPKGEDNSIQTHPSTITLIMASTLSKLVASSSTYPHEVIRTRLQNETTPPKKYINMWGTFVTIVREEGWRGLYRGMGTNLVRTVPASAFTLLSYETLMIVLRPF